MSRITPYWYQEEAVRSIFDYFVHAAGNPLVALPTGTGKAAVIAFFLERALKLWARTRVLCLTHVKELIQQNYDEFVGVWPEAPVGMYSAALKQRDTAMPIIFAGIASVKNCIDAFGWRDLVIIDEAHLLGPNDKSMYQTVIAALLLVNPNLKVIGLTATPYRMGQGLLTDGGLFTDICYDLTTMAGFNRLVDEGFLCPPTTKRTHTEIDTSEISIRQTGDFDNAQLEAAVTKVMRKAIEELCYLAADRISWIVFAPGIENSEAIAALLNTYGIRSAAVHSKLTHSQRDERIADFKEFKYRCLVSNNILTTGFNHKAVDCIAMMRPTMSVPLWCLDAQTEVLTADGFRAMNDIRVDTLIASMDVTTSHITYAPPLGYVQRQLRNDEYMVSLQSRSLDIRVSNKHRMLVQTEHGRNKTRSASYFVEADTLVGGTDVWIPTAGTNANTTGVALTDDELRLIGYYMTDGSIDKTTNALTLYQSERYPDVLNNMRACLQRLGIKFKESVHRRDPHYPMHRLRASFGAPRATDKQLRGWGFLSAWMTKDFAPALMDVSQQQFGVLLAAINEGDGVKNTAGIDWTRRTFTISTGNAVYAERLQITALRNGHRANLSHNGCGCLVLHIKPQQWNSVAASKDGRAVWVREDATQETVWCVQTAHGTLITRRNGKVAIMGNCQMIGRGTRPSPATHKNNCLVLDFAGNTRRLGPVNDPVIPRKKGSKGGDAPVRICDTCGTYNHASRRTCECCGAVFDFSPKIEGKASTDVILRTEASDLPIVESIEVRSVMYSSHMKKGGTVPCMKVQYLTGWQSIVEWVHLEQPYGSLIAKQARDWWRARHSVEPPATVQEALTYQSALRVPKRISVIVNRKYPEIIGYEY